MIRNNGERIQQLARIIRYWKKPLMFVWFDRKI